MKKCIYLFVMAVLSFTASAEISSVDLARQVDFELGKKYTEATADVASSRTSSSKKAPSLNAAPADIAGQYVFTSFNRDTINSSGLITITAGTTSGTYQVTGLHGAQSEPVTGTYANGKLTIAAGQVGYNHSTYGDIALYPMVNNTQYSTAEDIVLEFDESGKVELTSGVGFLMLITSGTYEGYSFGRTLTNGYNAYAANGDITSHMVNSDTSDADPASETYPTFTGFYEYKGSQYAKVAGIDDMTFFTILINSDNSVQVVQEPSYYHSSTYKVAYPCQLVYNETSGSLNFYPAMGPTGTIDYDAGTITLDMWGFFMENASTSGSYAVLNGRKYPSVITFTGHTIIDPPAEPEIPESTEFSCTSTPYSKFIENSQVNSYKNSLSISLKSGVASTLANKSRYIYRTNKATGEKTLVCTLNFTKSSNKYYCTPTYNSPMATSNSLRYDATALSTSRVNVTSTTSKITVNDYFTASTAEGGDKAGTYVYTIENGTTVGRVATVPVYAATVYAWPTTQEGPDAYTSEQIAADTDHALEAQDAYTVYLEDYSDGIESIQMYQDHSSVGTADFYYAYVVSSDVTQSTGFSVALKVGNNYYGTNEATAYAAVLGDVYAYDKVKSEATFNNGSRYFTCLLNAALNSAQGVSYETTGGGYRVWRTCETSDEYYEDLGNRANDYLFFDNVGLEESSMAMSGIGGESLKHGGSTYTSGTFGSSTEAPTVTMRIRAYYKAASSASAPRKVKAKDTDEVYSIAETLLEVSFAENVVTGLKEVTGVRTIKGINYYNAAGQVSNAPHAGVNIVVTTYEDGTTSTRKIVR